MLKSISDIIYLISFDQLLISRSIKVTPCCHSLSSTAALFAVFARSTRNILSLKIFDKTNLKYFHSFGVKLISQRFMDTVIYRKII